ncbi:uracil-DNA glycosylase [Spiroplasma corruscae]|uniref:Uracil-DNA glycosylase n=1 Tax=Spiroplasma corruscae TaxID=216934 RepID=A0A222EMQ6_9MOLU|nr:uracil-DNA glycosylase [Spiroplasma corruscae]ASP27802.1 uracil-DNA glycosylase [Spiroplasma corruscae]
MSWKSYLNNEWTEFILSNNLDFELDKIWKSLEQINNFLPPKELVFNLFNNISVNNIKVIILGQDPYHDIGQADGVAFSSFNDKPTPRSLSNIFKELKRDLNVDHKLNNSLMGWVKQGVFLINTSLTVEPHKPNSHKRLGWDRFIIKLLENLNHKNKNIIYCLWGNSAKNIYNNFKKKTKDVIITSHPSPFSFNKGFSGSSVFSKINILLINKQIKTIDWSL